MKYIDEFRDGALAKQIALRIAAEVRPDHAYRFMEFCGGHTHAISRYGVLELLPRTDATVTYTVTTSAEAGDQPLTVTLDDSHAMVPQMNLSSAARVVVGARISRSGSAQSQPGDLETLSDPIVTSRTDAIELVIDRIVP